MGVLHWTAVLTHCIGMIILVLVGCLTIHLVHGHEVSNSTDDGRSKKSLSVFNVVTFPNIACGATTGYNGTCYTASECTSKGGTASGTCASSFGVCCVFNLACGESTTQNNTYAIISSYSTSSDSDPCTYTICKQNAEVCKLRIDFDTMVLASPFTKHVLATEGPKLGDCIYDTLTVSNPGGSSPPIICGYNTGQHIYVPASDACNTINIDIDTGTTSTTRKWQIKTTQYECSNMRAPELDCLQYFTASSGTIATFNWDTSASTVADSQVHLSSQYYDVCFRRARSKCSICFSPQVAVTAVDTASSYGLGSSSDDDAAKNHVGSGRTGVTTQPADTGLGDYIEIPNLQPSIGSSGTVSTTARLCGAIFNAKTGNGETAPATACTFATPFKIGVHFDEGESLVGTDPTGKVAAGAFKKGENVAEADLATGDGYGYSGFWLAYWQNACT